MTRYSSSLCWFRRYVPELAGCDDEAVHAPWLMDAVAQKKAGVIIRRDYPAPVVDHDAQRKLALALYGRARRPQGGRGA